MPRISWLWFLIGIAFAMFAIPWLTSLLGSRRTATAKPRGA